MTFLSFATNHMAFSCSSQTYFIVHSFDLCWRLHATPSFLSYFLNFQFKVFVFSSRLPLVEIPAASDIQMKSTNVFISPK